MSEILKESESLKSRGDFQRFCADLRASPPALQVLVDALRALDAASLRPIERGRFAQIIAHHIGTAFSASEVRELAGQQWRPEVAMALRSHAPPSVAARDVTGHDDDVLLESTQERNSSLTVLLAGDEDEHGASAILLKKRGIDCRRVNSRRALLDAFERELVVGLVLGASWWTSEESEVRSPSQRMFEILGLSNLCWIKLVRSGPWASIEPTLLDLCMNLHHAEPSRSRLSIENQASITSAELSCLFVAMEDFVFAERNFVYDIQPSIPQERVLRASTSRYLRQKFPVVRSSEPRFYVRTLAQRQGGGFVGLVSVVDTDISFVVKVSSCSEVREEAQRFRLFAHGTSFEMMFFCHGTQGALVFAPIGSHLGLAPTLEGKLASRSLIGLPSASSIEAMDSAIHSLRRFSRQIQPKDVNTFCGIEVEETSKILLRCGPIKVAGRYVDLLDVYNKGRTALTRSSGRYVVQHGDAHLGNVLFNSAGDAVLIDYECVGLGPPCYDLSLLWIHALASHFFATEDECEMVSLCQELLRGVPLDVLSERAGGLKFAVNYEVVYLARNAIEASVCDMERLGGTREDAYGVMAVVLCQELLNVRLQQLVIRCALAAVSIALAENVA